MKIHIHTSTSSFPSLSINAMPVLVVHYTLAVALVPIVLRTPFGPHTYLVDAAAVQHNHLADIVAALVPHTHHVCHSSAGPNAVAPGMWTDSDTVADADAGAVGHLAVGMVCHDVSFRTMTVVAAGMDCLDTVRTPAAAAVARNVAVVPSVTADTAG
jgi:hypothetical protein